jgi:WD40 repeat protein
VEQGEGQGSSTTSTDTNTPKFVFEFKEIMRKQVSNFPVSAMSLSGDYSTLALGDTNGCITLLSTDTFQKIKFWECVHDLPVTCIAARPLPLALSGEDLTGVRVDVISASADNKLCYLTRQKKSTLAKKQKRLQGGVDVTGKSKKRLLTIFYPIHLIVFSMIVYAIKVAFDVCHEDYVESQYDWMTVKQCVLHTVLWATSDRPGIAVIPH